MGAVAVVGVEGSDPRPCKDCDERNSTTLRISWKHAYGDRYTREAG